MKKIINGTKYDTDTADLIGSFTAGGVCRRDYRYIHEELYRKKNGEFFLFGEGAAGTEYAQPAEGGGYHGGEAIKPLSPIEAEVWAEEQMDADAYETVFGPVAE